MLMGEEKLKLSYSKLGGIGTEFPLPPLSPIQMEIQCKAGVESSAIREREFESMLLLAQTIRRQSGESNCGHEGIIGQYGMEKHPCNDSAGRSVRQRSRDYFAAPSKNE
jgi:hypothetical protein